MSGLFDGTSLERPVTCSTCAEPLDRCGCPRGATGHVVLPADQALRVHCEKRGKGKVVTTVTGLDPVASDLPAILAGLKTACAAGGTVRDGRIEVQGDHRQRVLAALRDLGYRATPGC